MWEKKEKIYYNVCNEILRLNNCKLDLEFDVSGKVYVKALCNFNFIFKFDD